MKKRLSFILLSLLIVLFSWCDNDSNGPDMGTIRGKILDKDSKNAIIGVEITINGQVYVTDDGNYEVTDVPTGNHDIIAKKEEYVLFTEEVSVISGDNEYDIELEKMTSYCAKTPTIEYKGRIYNTVTIGNQCWFKESLNTGTMIDRSQDPNNSFAIEKYCYSNEESNCDEYGGLYQWDEAMQYITTEGAQGICPDDWHIPTLEEFHALNIEVDHSGYALLDVGQGYGTNTSGFSALLTGYRDLDGVTHSSNRYTPLWTSSDHNSDNASHIWMIGNEDQVFFADDLKKKGFVVRCLKD